MATVCYLEIDDEITGAIARLRGVTDGEAILVVPGGSRIATSRINFKLLAREANERRLNVVAVSDEPQVRALAISAGLPAYDKMAAAEQALATFREQDRKLAQRLGRDPDDRSVADEARRDRAAAIAAAAVTTSAAAAHAGAPSVGDQAQAMSSPPWLTTPVGEIPRPAAEQPLAESRRAAESRARRPVSLAPLLVAGLLVLLLASVGYGAYLFLPTATITLEPLVTEVRPQPFTVVADPDVAVTDVAAGVVPAERLEVPLTLTTTFLATGVQAHETRATGVIRFRSENTLHAVSIAVGTVVATQDGVEFETTEVANVPRADFATSTPGAIDVSIRALRSGTRGNVAAETITAVPASLAGQLVSARNPDATDGGRRVEEKVVSELDYGAAVIALGDQLEIDLAEKLRDPDTTPRGLTLFFTTAQTGDETITPVSAEIVGTIGETFDLTVTSTATVTAVNEGLVDELAETRLREGLAQGQSVVDDVVETSKSAGRVVIESIAYDVVAVAATYSEPDQQQLVALVRGKSVTDAQRILSAYGMVDISTWPEFVDRLPDQAARISLILVAPGEQNPSASPAPRISPRPASPGAASPSPAT
ncbi:MAG: baseplate J/gp47 family protein [Candidatus Limnocylindrales bacterium]